MNNAHRPQFSLDRPHVWRDGWDPAAPWAVWIPLVGPDAYDECGNHASPYGESYWPTWQDAVAFALEVVTPSRTVHVVSTVYWNGDEQGGSSFFWLPADNEAEAVELFRAEVEAWRNGNARVRLVTLTDVPATLTDEALTEHIDRYRLDDVETEHRARRVALLPEGR